MLAFLGGIALATAAVAQVSPEPAPDPCAGDPDCRQATAAELFATADALAAQGDLATAQTILEALTGDPHPELRAEARFRLAALCEQRGDLAGAVAALRALLEEKPDAHRARLELGRILALQGDAGGARRELRRAAAGGLPDDVARTVRSFSTALNSLRRRGASVELATTPDSNINHATSDKFVDTIIAPFELDPDARGQAGIGLALGAEAWSRDTLLGLDWLSRAGVHGDFYLGKKRFNDVQASVNSGPEVSTGFGQIRPALTYERRWFGGRAYSSGYGASVNWLKQLDATSQIQLDGSIVRQSIRDNKLRDGTRYAVSATVDKAFSPSTNGRFTLRGAVLAAMAAPESLHQSGGDFLLAHRFAGATLFGQVSYTQTKGRGRIFLFGKTREDDRVDLAAGLIAHALEYRGFSPILRLVYTRSWANISIYDYRRTRLELGFSRSF